jgi:hypothetical protein
LSRRFPFATASWYVKVDLILRVSMLLLIFDL